MGAFSPCLHVLLLVCELSVPEAAGPAVMPVTSQRAGSGRV